jgi:transposase
MIPMPVGTQIWVACGTTDMRKGFDGLAMLVQDVLKKAAYSGHLFVFRGKRADQDFMVGRHRPVPLCEAVGARAICLATDPRGRCDADAGAIVDAVRRHRLARAGPYRCCDTRGLMPRVGE